MVAANLVIVETLIDVLSQLPVKGLKPSKQQDGEDRHRSRTIHMTEREIPWLLTRRNARTNQGSWRGYHDHRNKPVMRSG